MITRSIVHLTTVHPRDDARIFQKQAQTVSSYFPHRVHLIVADGKDNVGSEPGGVSIHDLGRLRGGRLGRVLIGSWQAFFLLRRLNPAVVHFHDPELILLGLIMKLFGHKVIYDAHEDVPRQILGKHWIPRILRRPVALMMSFLEWFAAGFFDAMVAATPKIAERFPANKIVIVQNYPIDSEFFVPNKMSHEQRPKAFAYIGAIASIRGAIEIVQAFEHLVDVPAIRLELAGTFRPSSLCDKLKELPVWRSVHYHGQVSRSQVAQILYKVRAGLVLFHPSPNHIDAQPNKMFEYMSAGLPVIASDFPLWREIIEGVGCGILVDPMKPEAIAEAMRWILEHPSEAEDMGKRGEKAVNDVYNWDKEATKLVMMYRRLLAT